MTFPLPALRAEYQPVWMPVFPAGTISGRRPRTAPIAWVCPEGHRHLTREEVCRRAA